MAEGIDVARFACRIEPDVALVEAGVQAARACGASAVVALGGGSVIDAGKAIAALVPATRPLLDHLEVVGKGLPLDHAPLPFAALPTTAGTGAEVTRNAVLGVPGANRKVSLRDLRMLPRLAVVDPALTDGCPRAVTLASGLDAITQVIEPFVSSKANPMTDALCRAAIPRGLAALQRLMGGEDAGARDEMAFVSLCGGLTLANAGLGAVHGLAGPLGGLTGAAHGALCGVLLAPVLRANRQAAGGEAAERLDEVGTMLSAAFGLRTTGLAAATEALSLWAAEAGLPGLRAQGVSSDAMDQAAGMAVSASSMKANPVPLTVAVLRDVLQAAG
jgi:alcohol dehydrogenase class IV